MELSSFSRNVSALHGPRIQARGPRHLLVRFPYTLRPGSQGSGVFEVQPPSRGARPAELPADAA